MRQITYAYKDSPEFENPKGNWVSRIGSEVAWPILLYGDIGKGGNFNKDLTFQLEKIPVREIKHWEWNGLVWTKNVPLEIKNWHREFWGLKPLPYSIILGLRFKMYLTPNDPEEFEITHIGNGYVEIINKLGQKTKLSRETLKYILKGQKP